MKKIIEITSIEELMEMSVSGAATGPSGNAFKLNKEEATTMRKEIQTEMMMRKYIRGKIKKQLHEQKKKESEQEHQLRLVIRGLIKEAKEMANPHPNTGINKLRDAFRKAKPTLKAKYQQLTSTAEQRETFTSHMLRAFVRLFDELDALQAQGDIDRSLEDIESAAGSLGTETGLEAPPENQTADDIESELDSLLEEVYYEVQSNLAEQDIDIVSDDEMNIESAEDDKVPDDLKKHLKSGELNRYEKVQSAYNIISKKPESKDEFMQLYSDIVYDNKDPEGLKNMSTYKGFNNNDFGILLTSLEEGDSPIQRLITRLRRRKEEEDADVVSDDERAEAEKNKSQAEKDFNKKKEKEAEKAEFGGELEGDTTGRNQAFDAFRLVQSYFSDAYLDLANADDQKMYRDWCLYNLKLLFQNFEESLPQAPDQPNIENPEGV